MQHTISNDSISLRQAAKSSDNVGTPDGRALLTEIDASRLRPVSFLFGNGLL